MAKVNINKPGLPSTVDITTGDFDPTQTYIILLENGDFLITEDSDLIIQENG